MNINIVVIEKTLDVAITKCYGNADESNTRGKLNIPKKIVKAMGLTEDDRMVVLRYNEEKRINYKKSVVGM